MYSRERRLRKRKLSFVFPLIIALVIVVGVVFLIRMLIRPSAEQPSNGLPVASFTLSSGKARVILAGNTTYSIDPSPTPTSLNVGEGVETQGAARINITFQDGSIIRLDSNSAVKINDYKSINNKKNISVTLNRGNGWLNVSDNNQVDSFEIVNSRSLIRAREGIFAITHNETEDIYRGIQSKADIVGFDRDPKSNVGQPVSISLGQQVVINDQVIGTMKSGGSQQLLSLIDDSFRSSDWYRYNVSLDNNEIAPVLTNGNNTVSNPNSNTAEPNSNTGEDDTSIPDTTGNGPVIRVTSPAADSTINEGTITIRGTVSKDAVKVVVDDYTLQKYVSGSGTWYYIASASGGNLLKGRNIFKIYAVDKNGNKGAVVNHAFTYNPQANSNSSSSSSNLSAPVITSPSGGSAYETSNSKIDLGGSVGSGIQKVYVNGYQLQKYTPGSGKWLYYAYEEYGTLKPGANSFSVYGVDANGKKTPAASIKITYTKNSSGSGTTVP